MKKTAQLITAGALTLVLTACGGGASAGGSGTDASSAATDAASSAATSDSASDASSTSASATGTATSAAAVDLSTPPTTGIDISTIDPGWQPNEDDENGHAGTSDIWYAVDDATKPGIYFNNAANDAGLSLNFIDTADKTDLSSIWDLEVAGDHLVTLEGSDSQAVDIVFADDFNCYDFARGTWYSRGDQSYFDNLFAGKTLVKELKDGELDVYELAPDHTAVHTSGKYDPETATWRSSAVNVLEFTFDSDGYQMQFRYKVDAAGNVEGLDDFADYEIS